MDIVVFLLNDSDAWRLIMEFTHVDGKNRGKVILYAISTCVWCKKTKKLLEEMGIAYDFIDVDLLGEEEKEPIRQEVIKWKSRVAYPLIVVNDDFCIPNFDEDTIRETFGS